VIGRIVGLHRQECACPDMQGQRLAPDPPIVEQGEQPLREMQRRRGGGDRPHLPGENGLVIVAVGFIDAALARDVGRQRHFACALKQELDRLVAVKMEKQRSGFVPADTACANAALEFDDVAIANPLRIPDEGPPTPQILALVKRCPDACVSAAPFELGGNDARVIEHQHVTGTQDRR
jgi:hypothetical protein